MRASVYVLFISLLVSAPGYAQGPSAASQAIASTGLTLSEATLGILLDGGALVLDSVEVAANVGSSVVITTTAGVSVPLKVSTEVAARLLKLAGKAVERVAISGGWLLQVSGEIICFVPSALASTQIHRRVLSE